MVVKPAASAARASATHSSGFASWDHHETGQASRYFGPISRWQGTPAALPAASKQAICRPAPRPSSQSRSKTLRPRLA